MKRCPECRRDYYDETLRFCLDDGNALLEGPATADEPATVAYVSADRPDSPETLLYTNSDTAAAKSIAVLPFKNISADAENEYFCEGLAEELLNALAKIRELKVAARMSAFSFKDQSTEVGEIGRKLGVATILEGSVRKAGNRLRISVQLVSATDGYHIWSESFDREMRDIFDVQDEITLSVVEALKLKLLGNTRKDVLKRETENTQAYGAYLRGRYLRYAKNDHSGAALAYENAVRLDPQHTPSWIGLAESYVLRAHYALIHPLDACAKTRDALAKANTGAKVSAEALYVEGFAAFIERDWPRWDVVCRRSIELDPSSARSLGTFGMINCVLGNVDEGMKFLEHARAADPLAAYPYAISGCGLTAIGRPNEALPFFDQAFAFERDNTLALWSYSIAAVAVGDYETAIEAAERSVSLSNRAGLLLGQLGFALASAGRTQDAKAVLAELERRPSGSPVVAFEACLLAALGNKKAALELYSRAIDEHAPSAYYFGMPCYDALRDEPEFEDIVKRLEFPISER